MFGSSVGYALELCHDIKWQFQDKVIGSYMLETGFCKYITLSHMREQTNQWDTHTVLLLPGNIFTGTTVTRLHEFGSNQVQWISTA